MLNAAASTAVAAFGKDGGVKARREFQKLMKRLAGSDDAPETPQQALADKLRQERQGHD